MRYDEEFSVIELDRFKDACEAHSEIGEWEEY